MKQRSKNLVCLILSILMVVSVIGYGICAFAETPVGKQVSQPETSFDSNGWFTQDAYNALEDKTNTVSTDPGVSYLAHLAPESINGYTAMASFANGKIINNKQLSVEQAVSFEFALQAGNGAGNRFIHFVDSASMDGYLGLKESNTALAVMFNEAGNQAEIYAKGKQQTLANGNTVWELEANRVSIWDKTPVLHYVSVSIGAEKTQVFIDGEMIAELTAVNASDFASGKVQLVMDFWGGGGDPFVFFSAFDPFVVAKASLHGSINVKMFEDDLTFVLSKPVSQVSIENAKGETVILEAGKDYTADGNTITVKNSFLTEKEEGFFNVNTTFSFTSTEDPSRTAEISYEILYYAPPVYEQTKTTIIKGDLTEDVTFAVTYENDETYTMNVNGTPLAAENFNAVYADGKINVTLKKEYLNSLTHGTYTFELNTLAGSVQHVVYCNEHPESWQVMGNGTTGDESVTNDGKGSSTVNLTFMGNAYYTENIDVTKPIYLEMDIDVTAGAHYTWFVIGFTNDVTQVNKLTEANPADRLSFLYAHDKGEFQSAGILANAVFKPEYINQNGPQLFEICFAEADENGKTVEGQMTTVYFNGYKIFETDTRNQATFKKGCFLGLYSGVDSISITMRTDPTAPVANTYGLEYTLGTDTDLTIPFYNTTEVSQIRFGDEILDSTDYSYADGKLTIYGDYLKNIPYAEMLNFVVVADNNTEVKVNVKALCEVDADKAVTAVVGESGAVFEKAFAGKTVQSVIDAATSVALSQDQYEVSSDGTLTIKSSYFTEIGTYSFAVVTNEGLNFAMAIYQNYENGWANQGETANGTFADETLTVKGEMNYLYEGIVDISEGKEVAYTLDVKTMNGYFKSGQSGSVESYISIYLYDMFSGNTITLAIYANDTEESGAQMAYVKLFIRDKDGKSVFVNNTAIADNPNFFDESIFCANVIRFAEDNNSLRVDFNDYSIFLDIGNTVLSNLQLGVATTEDLNGVQNEFSFSFKVDETEDPDNNGDGDTTEPQAGGCSGSIDAVAVLGAAVFAGTVSFVLIKRKKNIH